MYSIDDGKKLRTHDLLVRTDKPVSVIEFIIRKGWLCSQSFTMHTGLQGEVQEWGKLIFQGQ